MKVVILQIISIILQGITYTYLFENLSKIIGKIESISKKKTLLIFIGMSLSISIAILIKDFFKIPLLNTIVICLLFIIIEKYILNITTIKSFFITIIALLIFLFSEYISIYILTIVSKNSIENIINTQQLSIIMLLIQSFLIFIMMKILVFTCRQIKFKIPISNYLNKKNIILFFFLVLLFILPQMILYVLNYKTYPIYNIIINSFQIIVICAILFVFFKQSSEMEKAESDLNNTKIHNRTMIGMVDGVRTIKHDYNNIIQAMNGYIATKQYDKLQNHINMVMEECNLINNLSTIDPKIFNEPAIYGIVGSKFFLAQEKDIPMELDVTTNIKDISFDMPLLSRILGIFLDNAIEATSKTENKFIRLEMRFDKKKCADIIRVYNTYDQKVQNNLQDIYEKGFSTKKVKSGIGLWEVKKIVTKNKHSQVFATIEHGKFVQNLIIERI